MNPWLRSRYVASIGLGLGLVLLAGGLLAQPWWWDHHRLVDYFRMLHQVWAMVAFVLVQAMATAVGLPGTVLVLAGGAIFGLALGTVLSVLGATLGAIAAFGIARYLLQRRMRRWFKAHPFLQQCDYHLDQNPLLWVLVVRLAPISPFNVLNFVFGVTPVPLRPYAIGTGLGILPGTLVYTWVGVTGVEVLRGGQWWPLGWAIASLGLLSVLPWVIKHWRSRSGKVRR